MELAEDDDKLAFLRRIRDRVCEALSMPSDFELRSELCFVPGSFSCRSCRDCDHPGVMGLCQCDYGPLLLQRDNAVKLAEVKKGLWIEVRLRHEPDGEGQRAAVSVASLVATLLHELAHAATPMTFRKGVVRELGKKSSRKFRPECHGAAFYESYRRVLQVAEEKRIFVLPPVPDKFGAASLARFDAIDCNGGIPPGTALVLPDELPAEKGELTELGNASETVRVVVMYGSSAKSLALKREGLTTAGLLRAAKAKLNAKGKMQLLLPGNAELTDLDQISNDARLTLRKK